MNKSVLTKGSFVLSMTVFGTIGVLVRFIGLSSSEIALYRAVMAAVLVGGYLLISGQKISVKNLKGNLLLLLISGGAMGINWVLLFEAYKYTTVSTATLSYYFAPVIVTVLSPIVFREKMTVKAWICFGASTLGLVLITGVGDGAVNIKGILFGLSAAVFYATVMILNKFITGVGGIVRTFMQFVASLAVLIPYVIFDGGFHLGEIDSTGAICLITVGILHTGIAYCLYFSSLGELRGQEVAILSYVDPLVAVIISVAVLGEPLTLPQIVGGVLILGFTLWNELSSNKSN